MSEYSLNDWLPISKKEVDDRGWPECDVILVTGDAYVDHPAFGAAVIGRLIESEGYRVGILAQPNWRDDLRDFKKMGRPRLFFGVTAGNMDSMVNHYTAGKRLRSTDAYTAGGKAGFRPDYSTVVYTSILKRLYPDVPVVLGGIEGSLRRFAHYDYWKDIVLPSILIQSGADLLVYGLGDRPIIEVSRLLDRGIPIGELTTIRQTAYAFPSKETLPSHKTWDTLELASFEDCRDDKTTFAKNFAQIERETSRFQPKRLVQKTGDQIVVVNPPYPPLTEREIDRSFDLPYTRLPHPRYRKRGEIPAFEMIQFSLNLHRGCFGGCAFCAIAAHQGKFISSRSRRSILKEVTAIKKTPGFKGFISDLGGPTANMYKMKGIDLSRCERCVRASCVYPDICDNLCTDHGPLLELYREIRTLPDIKAAYVGSGVRYDLFLSDDDKNDINSHRAYMEELVRFHVSGRLKVAPEHTSDRVLKQMRKPSFKLFKRFKAGFDRINRRHRLNLQLIPYFISSHPGCDLTDMVELAAETKALGYKLEQIQDFMPTPMTLSSVIYYSGIHPKSLKPVYTARSKSDKRDQRRFFFWYQKENRQWIKDQLRQMGTPHLLN